jgi:hypothetical protein
MPITKKAVRTRRDKSHDDAVKARERVLQIIDAIPPEDLVSAIKRAPSLRGMILGYIAEEMFEKYLPGKYPGVSDIEKHDDHNREENKSDRTITYCGRRYGIQLKSVQTNSISFCPVVGGLYATVQNDASDARTIKLPNGSTVVTTCYARGEYDILAVPLFPFTGKWEFAYKLNADCRECESSKYTVADRVHLLATTESITYPLDGKWTNDLKRLLHDECGKPAKA